METNQEPSSGIEQDFPEAPRLAQTNEANLLWDEYKYRHDLVWRHLIRSTLALVGLVTVRYSSAFKPTVLLVLIAWMVALGYWLITLLAIEPELRLLSKVRHTHRIRQNKYFQLSHPIEEIIEPVPWGKIFFVDKFSRRVGIYLLLLLVATFYAGIIALIDPGPVINSHAFYLNIVFSTGMTNFIFIGIPFEELDLVKAYGERYERHRHQPWGRESAF